MEPNDVKPEEDIAPDQVLLKTWNEAVQTGENSLNSYGTGVSPIAQPFQSANFKSGFDGWRLDSNGNLEANDGNFRGDITGASGTFSGTLTGGSLNIPDTTTDSSFHVEADGDTWWGNNVADGHATAPAKILKTGDATFSSVTITGGSITSTPISSIPNNSSTDISLLGLTYDMVFSVTDADTIAWSSGTITLSNGRTFAISAGNTGNMSALTYIYLDPAVSSTVLQVTTTNATAMGANKALIGTAQNHTVTASFIPFNGSQPLIDGANIGALSIVAGNIAASTITAGKLSVSQLSAITADMGAITAGSIVMPSGGFIRAGQTAFNTGTGFYLGNDSGTPKFSIGVSTGDNLTWDGTTLEVAGTFNIGGTSITVDTFAEAVTALATVEAAGGGTVYLQNGTYTLTSDLAIPGGVTLQGVSRDGVILDCDGTYAVTMSGTDSYTTGTAAINDGDTTVVGSGTTWTSGMIGRYIYLSGLWYEITARADNTHITISPAYSGANITGYAYAIANPNFNATLRKVTITGATGAGLEIIYTNEPWIDDIVVYDCGTGLDLDYVVYPKIFCLAEENGVNMNMNYVSGFKVDYCSFSFSTTGAGVVMTNVTNSTFMDSAVDVCTGDGINLTNCDSIAFISATFNDNGGQGAEFVSGVNDCQFMACVADGNTSDGIKLTATADRNSIVASSITNNGGYGINIVASTCDDNQVTSPAFSGNVAGKINDQGTNTSISPGKAPTIFNPTQLTATGMFFSDDSSRLPVYEAVGNVIILTGGTGRYQRRTVSSDWAAADRIQSAVLLGSYLYLLLRDTDATPDEFRVYRYDKDALSSGGTLMTFAGTAPDLTVDVNLRLTSDGTNFYLNYQGGNSANAYILTKYTISGTEFTHSANITCGSATLGFNSNYAVLLSGNIFTFNVSTFAISKFNSSGTLQYTDTSSVINASVDIMFNIDDNLYGYAGTQNIFTKFYYTN